MSTVPGSIRQATIIYIHILYNTLHIPCVYVLCMCMWESYCKNNSPLDMLYNMCELVRLTCVQMKDINTYFLSTEQHINYLPVRLENCKNTGKPILRRVFVAAAAAAVRFILPTTFSAFFSFLKPWLQFKITNNIVCAQYVFHCNIYVGIPFSILELETWEC